MHLVSTEKPSRPKTPPVSSIPLSEFPLQLPKFATVLQEDGANQDKENHCVVMKRRRLSVYDSCFECQAEGNGYSIEERVYHNLSSKDCKSIVWMNLI